MEVLATPATNSLSEWRVGFKPSVVAWSLAVALLFLVVGGWLAAGEFWFGDPSTHDWEHGLFWLVFTFSGLFFTGTWVAAALGRLRTGDALAADAHGIKHFALGHVAWRDMETLRINQAAKGDQHSLLSIFKAASSNPKLQLELVLKPLAYKQVALRLNRLDRVVFMMSVSFYNAPREVILHCWSFACETSQLAQSLMHSGAEYQVPVQDLTNAVAAPRRRKQRE
jgi:hypothetical protein